MNAFSQTPLLVKQYFDGVAGRNRLATELKIMIPGDEWSSDKGFTVSENDYFDDRERRLREYEAQIQPTLVQYYVKEDGTRVSLALMAKFFRDLWARTPFILRRRLGGEKILLISVNAGSRSCFGLDLSSGSVQEVLPDKVHDYVVRTEFPAIVLAQSIRMNMFSQAWISKRVHYYTTRQKVFVLKAFLRILELNEAELLPLRKAFTFRSFRALLPRWREGLLYLHVVSHLLRRRNFLEIETRLLKA